MQKKCLEIFGLKLYKINSKNIIKSTGDIHNICEIYTKENKGYHIKLFNKDNVILFGDVDHINNKSIFKEILNALSDFLILISMIFHIQCQKNQMNILIIGLSMNFIQLLKI